MTDGANSLILILIACGIQLCVAIALVAWGRRAPKAAPWIVGLAFALHLGALAFAWSAWVDSGYQPFTWSEPWFEPIVIGLGLDPFGLLMASLSSAVAMAMLASSESFLAEPRHERCFAAILAANVGASVAALSSTPWLGLLGLLITVLAAFLSHASRWDIESEALQAIRESYERVGALVVSIFGAGMMLTPAGASLGPLVLAAGLFLQFRAFPLLGSLSGESEAPGLLRLATCRVIPGLTAFVLIARLESQLRNTGSSSLIAWIALAAAALTLFTGLFQSNWKQSLSAWISAGMPVAIAVFFLSSSRDGILFAIATTTCSAALAASGGALDVPGTHSLSNRKRAVWAKAAAVVAVVALVGFPGFAAASGTIPWIARAMGQPELLAAELAVLTLAGLLGWKIFWTLANLRASSEASWRLVLAPWILILLAVALFWTGDPLGDVIPSLAGEKLFGSMVDSAAQAAPSAGAGEDDLLNSLAAVSGVALATLLLSLWIGRREDRWLGIRKSAPRFAGFVVGGFGMDRIAGLLLAAFSAIGSFLQSWVDGRVWNLWIPSACDWVCQKSGAGISAADGKFVKALEWAPRKGVDVPSKLLQLVHNGNFQWYLLLALASGAAILVHFLIMTGAA